MLACADFHISPGSWHLKTDAPSRGERLEKCDQSMRIGEYLAESTKLMRSAGHSCADDTWLPSVWFLNYAWEAKALPGIARHEGLDLRSTWMPQEIFQ